jgi:hypothetical protein
MLEQDDQAQEQEERMGCWDLSSLKTLGVVLQRRHQRWREAGMREPEWQVEKDCRIMQDLPVLLLPRRLDEDYRNRNSTRLINNNSNNSSDHSSISLNNLCPHLQLDRVRHKLPAKIRLTTRQALGCTRPWACPDSPVGSR